MNDNVDLIVRLDELESEQMICHHCGHISAQHDPFETERACER